MYSLRTASFFVLSAIGFLTFSTAMAPAQTPPPCTCNGDVDGSGGPLQVQDWICIQACIGGDCTCCASSCDVNCDGVVNALDAGPDLTVNDGSAFLCLWTGGSPDVCCAPPPTGVCCTGITCSELDLTACVAAGGDYGGDNTRCTADTCAPPPGPTPTGACCRTSDCLVETADQCAVDGGTYQGDDTICSATICPPPPNGACCLTFDCILATADSCAAQGGAYNGDNTTCTAATCAPPPCTCDGDVDGSGGPLQVQDWLCIRQCIAGNCTCCVNSCDLNCDGLVNDLDAGPDLTVDDGSVFRCFWVGIDPAICCAPPPTGACCLGIACSELDSAGCLAIGGEYLGDNTVCGADTCTVPPPTPNGACCLTSGCLLMTADECAVGGGVYQGDNTGCSATTCPPPPTGACCVTFDCLEATADGCAAEGGAYSGDNTACTATTCVPPPCTCDGDVDGDGFIRIQDWLCIQTCIAGNCSCCVNSCDLNCDGLVNELDAGPDPTVDNGSIFHCFFVGTSADICCAPPPPPPPTGACCLTFDCVVTTAESCAAEGGVYNGDNTACTAATCAPPPCTCDGDVDGDGFITIQDSTCIRECISGNCTCCVNSCDLNCDGLVNDLDAGPDPTVDDTSVFHCFFVGISPDICCAPPPPPPTGACCLTFDCVEATADGCVAQGGAYNGDNTACTAATCAPPPCTCDADVDGDGLIRIQDWLCIQTCIDGDCTCCVNSCDLNCDGLVNELDAGPDLTVDSGSVFHCFFVGVSPDVCCAPPTRGACCVGDACLTLTATHCAEEGGTFLGDNTECTSDRCTFPAPGACCLDGACDELTNDICEAEGGEFLGKGTTCTDGVCTGGAAGSFATGLRNRYLSFATGNQPQIAAVRVVFLDLPTPFDRFNGLSMWVGAPSAAGEPGSTASPLPGFASYQSATLQCSPYVTDWQSAGTIYVRHEDIIPGGTYKIEFVDAMLAPVGSPVLVTMSSWGDLAGTLDASGQWTAPDGSVDVTVDVLGAIAKFAGAPTAMRKVRADVEPATPDQVINIADVLQIVRAFQGLPYPFVPGPPPCGG